MVASQEKVNDEEPEELVRFRQEWRAEVERKKKAGLHVQEGVSGGTAGEVGQERGIERAYASLPVHFSSQHPESSSGKSQPNRAPPRRPVVTPLNAEPAPSGESTLHPLGESVVTAPPLGNDTALSRAVEVYHQAMLAEQRSDLDEALRLYRQAFRMDENVHQAYRAFEKKILLQSQSQSQSQHAAPSPLPAHTVEDITHGLKTLEVSTLPLKTRGSVTTTDITKLFAQSPHELSFEPEDEKQPLPLRKLPDELLVHILTLLDHTTIERFATINKKARIISLDSSIWRDFVRTIYRPPQVPDEKYMRAVEEQYLYDYRRIYVEHPRIRLDGVYIAVCHYIRAGLSENAWMNISHLITYHRYLRFFPNGQVLSLLANEEMGPQQVVPLLKPSFRMKGFAIGTWHLTSNTLHLTDLLDPHHLDKPHTPVRYAFQMTLTLRSRPLGRWNKLDLERYETVDVETGEAAALPLRHERPFWFSRVRSYAP